MNKLDPTKSTTGVSIRLLKGNSDICAPLITSIFSSCIKGGIFPDKLKIAVITPIFKSVDSMAKNYRPVSILNFFKAFRLNVEIFMFPLFLPYGIFVET